MEGNLCYYWPLAPPALPADWTTHQVIAQDRACWLNLFDLSDKQKHDIVDEGVEPYVLFGTAVATIQKWCEEKKKWVEAL